MLRYIYKLVKAARAPDAIWHAINYSEKHLNLTLRCYQLRLCHKITAMRGQSMVWAKMTGFFSENNSKQSRAIAHTASRKISEIDEGKMNLGSCSAAAMTMSSSDVKLLVPSCIVLDVVNTLAFLPLSFRLKTSRVPDDFG
mmetsp:Transcript_3938/g.7557  ORF Transcript_3938/g.7557 Transcript_3938/m.7557 type:complete len:141 (+) Transcript_3938:23-445(+)